MKRKLNPSLYWKCQLIGWAVASLYWELQGMASGKFMYGLGVLQFVSDVLCYVLITHLYRNFALKHGYDRLGINRLIGRIIPAALILAIAFAIVTIFKIYLYRIAFVPGYTERFADFFQAYSVGIFITGIRLMSIWLLAYHLYHYARREIQVTKENARLEIISREAQLNNLSAQLNPHFLFNSLNNIKALVANDPGSARRAIDLLSDILRMSLYSGEDLLTPLQDELNLVMDYLELEKLRFEERLQFDLKLDETLPAIMVPRFSLQILVDNAVKHGIAKLKEGGAINIEINLFNGSLQIRVQNPGRLEIKEETTGVGLKNLRERLELHYQHRATLEIVGKPGSGVLATLNIPMS